MSLFNDDHELLAAFRRGCPRAMERVYHSCSGLVEGHVRAWVREAQLHDSLVADFVQETFLRAFAARARAGFDAQRDFSPYLVSIARNCLIDFLRRKRREVLDAPTNLVGRIDAESARWDEVSEPKLNAVLTSYVDSLPPELRRVLEQRVLLERSQSAACAALGVTRQRLRSGEHQLRLRLRKQLILAGVPISELQR
jgi:RNA polymerase sigma-70 factor (ECF subfamily)